MRNRRQILGRRAHKKSHRQPKQFSATIQQNIHKNFHFIHSQVGVLREFLLRPILCDINGSHKENFLGIMLGNNSVGNKHSFGQPKSLPLNLHSFDNFCKYSVELVCTGITLNRTNDHKIYCGLQNEAVKQLVCECEIMSVVAKKLDRISSFFTKS